MREPELFHTFKNEDITMNCYYHPDEQNSNYSHSVVASFANGSPDKTLFTDSRQGCIALCVEVEEGFKS